MRYKIVVGDWSDDGHGKTETFIYEVDCNNKEVLFKAFQRNIRTIGFDPASVCDEYEDYEWPEDVVSRLEELGFDCGEQMAEDYANMLMFFFTYGTLFTYSLISEDEMPTLIGDYDAVTNNHYGYGITS